MTTPTITTIEPSKSKTWVAVVGTVLTALIPYVLQAAEYVPDPWPLVIGGVIAVLTALGVYKAPYKPEGTSVVPNSELNQVAVPLPPVDKSEVSLPPAPGDYRNPWK